MQSVTVFQRFLFKCKLSSQTLGSDALKTHLLAFVALPLVDALTNLFFISFKQQTEANDFLFSIYRSNAHCIFIIPEDLLHTMSAKQHVSL